MPAYDLPPYERFASDGHFRQSFIAEYAGNFDPADALWWLEHEGTAPSGAADPRDTRQLLGRAQYESSPPLDVVERLRVLDEQWLADRHATLRAILRADRAMSVRPPSAPGQIASVRTRVVWAIGGAVIASALLVGGYFSVTKALSPGGAIVPTHVGALPSETPVPPSVGYLAVFDRAAMPVDTPTFALPRFDTGTYRFAADLAEPDGSRFGALFFARIATQLCLVVGNDAGVVAVSCATSDQLTDSGINLSWLSGGKEQSATWASDGSVSGSFDLYTQASQ